MSDIEIEIDGKPLTVKANTMVIQAADEAGIYIPRFCYHKQLSIAANCRMCLVEVEKAPKTLPACATPVAPNMKVFTRSPKALAAQKAVMEFLLINHPLDCPICDQGGECELQDLSMGFGAADTFYSFGKRSVADEDLGPLISTEMTRCIQCTRCVRFGDEIAGLRELGATGRGENMEIGTYVKHAMRSEISGNIIDLCPVGALTSKPFRFTARAWELNQYPTVAAHDCTGSNLHAHTRGNKVMRMVPRENNDINEMWISDRDRFSYEGLNHPDRLEKPMVLIDDQWHETDWQTALETAVTNLQRVIDANSANDFGALASPNSTVEEFYLLQKLMRQLGSSNVDHRLRQVDFSDQENMPLFPGLSGAIADLEKCDVILLIGSHIQAEQPMLGVRVRKAARFGAKVIAINMMDYHFNFPIAAKKIVAPHLLPEALIHLDDAIVQLLRAGKKVCVLVGIQAFHHPKSAALRAAAEQIAREYNATLGYLTEGANAAGAWMAGAVPHRGELGSPVNYPGLDAYQMLKNPRKAYVLLNVEPEFDCANAPMALNALAQAESVVALTMYKNPLLLQYAKVILPVTPFTETAGTFVNVSGEWQRFTGVVQPLGEARPAWKVLRVLGNLFHCEGFDYESAHEISEQLKTQPCHPDLCHSREGGNPSQIDSRLRGNDTGSRKISRIGEIPLYAGDSMQRHAKSLQATQPIITGDLIAARIHPDSAKALQVTTGDRVSVTQGENRIHLPVVVDARIPRDALHIFGGILAAKELSELYGPIEIHKA